MDLAVHQRKLLGLIRDTYQVHPDDDAYIHGVAHSKDLKEARRNVFMWRIFVLERTAPLTFTYLKRRHLLEAALSTFIQQENISPFRETQAPAFLEAMGHHTDRLVASVAQFELALMKVKQGAPETHVVTWDIEPHALLKSLVTDLPLEGVPREGNYQIIVSRDVPSHFQIVSIETADENRNTYRGD
jgi:hypothetical protein